MVPPSQFPPSNDDAAIKNCTNPFTHIGMKSTWDAIIRDGLPAPGSGQVGIAITTPFPPAVSNLPPQCPTFVSKLLGSQFLITKDKLKMSHLSCKCNSHFRQCRQFSPFLLRDQLFPLYLRLLWYFKLIADIIATTSVDATSGKNLWYVDCTSCCSDTTLVWNRTRPPSYCPNTSQLFISLWFSKYKKQYYFEAHLLTYSHAVLKAFVSNWYFGFALHVWGWNRVLR